MATGGDNVETSPCISVRGLSMSYSEEDLTYYFENKRRSGGGEVEAVTKVDREGVFYVKFVNPEDAARVASREHCLNGQKVEVRVYTPPQTLADRVLVRGLPYLETGTELGLYVESRADSDVKSILYGDEGMAVVIFRENIDFQNIQEGVKKRQFKNVTLVVEPLAGCYTVQVRNLPTSPRASEESLTNYFENERRCGGGEVTKVQLGEKGDYALITFADFKGTKEAVSEIQRLVESLKKKKIVMQKTFQLPSFARYLASSEGQSKVKDIEHRLECKIIDQTQQCFALLTSGQDSGSAHNSLQFGQGAAHADSSDDGQQRPTRNLADPKPQPEPKQKRDELPAKPRIFLNPMSDITKEEHNVLVNSSNRSLTLSNGQVSEDLLSVGGPELQRECAAKYPKGITYGEVAVTGKGRPNGLFCKNVFHCCLKEEKNEKKIKEMIKKTTTMCLEKANEMGHTSIGFPALGTGTLQFPPKTVAKAMFEAAIKFGRKHPDCCLSDVVIILHKKDEEVTKVFKEVKEKYAAVSQDPLDDFKANPNSRGVQEYPFFEKASKPVTLVFAALEQGVTDRAEKELVKGYDLMVSKMKPLDACDLQCWDDFHIRKLKRACRISSVDLILMFKSNKIQLRGFLEDVGKVPYSTIMNEAEAYVHARKSAHIMPRQVRWSWVEVDITEEQLRPYNETNNYIIENSYREGKDSVSVYDINNQGFRIRFDTMDEVPERLPNDQTRDEPVRVIRQDLIHEVPDAPLPPHWSQMLPDDPCGEVLLKVDSTDYRWIAERFRKSYQQPNCQIVKISRIQNPTLYRQYMAKRMELKNSLPPDTHVEREPLWHGTKGDSVQSIIHLGFNRSYCRQDGTRNAYGDGVYFATTAAYASRDEYATAGPLGQRHVFLCRVLVGQYIAGTRGMRVLPAVTGAGGRCYNSAVDDPADPRMFVVFSDIQAYPKYLIVFK